MKLKDWFYHLASFSVRNFARLFYDLRIYGAEKVPPADGTGLVLVSNHISSFDPPILGSSVPRVIDYMAKKELFESSWWFRQLILELHAFPIDREGNAMGGIKEAMRRTKKGLAVGIFIQGTRNAGNAEALEGAAFIAQRAGVPLQPAAIRRDGRRFRVHFGDPVYPSSKSRAETKILTEGMMQEIARLLEAPLEVTSQTR